METTSHYYHVHVELICKAYFEVHRYAMLSKINHMLIIKIYGLNHSKSFKVKRKSFPLYRLWRPLGL
jgi:hypothetical protein